MRHHARRTLPLLLLPLLAACEAAPEPPADPPPVSQAPTSAETRLAGEELTGLEPENVAFTLPWVGGPVNREPTADAGVVALREVSVIPGGSFDRVVFTFADGDFPGYNLEWVHEPPQECAGQAPAEMEGPHFLRTRLRSVGGGQDLAPTAPAAGSNLRGMAVTCSRAGELEWHLGLAESGDIRIVEMRSPQRLVVDVRRPSRGGG
jgi:hypothetical protein